MKKQLCLIIALVLLAGFITVTPSTAAASSGPAPAAGQPTVLADPEYLPGDDQPDGTVLGTVLAESLTLWAEEYEGSDSLGEFEAGVQIRLAGCRGQVPEQVHRALVQRSAGRAIRVPFDSAVPWIGGAGVDAGQTQGH